MVSMIIRLAFIVAACAFMYATTNQVLSGKLNLSPNGFKRFNNLQTFIDKLQFTFVHLSVPVLLMLVQVILTIFSRLSTKAIDPSADNDKHVFRANSILRNYFEQFVISAFSQLALISHLTAKQTLQFIPLINLFFVVGYPKFRSFGFVCCMVPSLLSCVVSSYEFLAFAQLIKKV